MALAAKVFAELVTKVLKAKGYSDDIANQSWDETIADKDIPEHDRNWLQQCGYVWDHLIDEDYDIDAVEPVIASSNLFYTPKDTSYVQELLESAPKDQHAIIMMAIMYTVNYINARQS